MIKIYDIGRKLNINYKIKYDEKLKFSLFPYSGDEIINTSIFVLLVFVILGSILSFIFNSNLLFITIFFFGLVISTVLFLYPIQIYYLTRIMEYKSEMLLSIMKLATYLTMNSNLEYAIFNTMDNVKGILRVQFRDILIKLERKQFLNLSDAFKHYAKIWNKFSPDFVDALKLLEIASLASPEKTKEILDETIEHIILSYNIEQKRRSEELINNISQIITLGILMPVMFLMLIPLVSIFLPSFIKASVLFIVFDILIPTFLLISGLNFSAKRIQVRTIDINLSKDYQTIPLKIYVIAFISFFVFFIPGILYFIYNDPSKINFNNLGLATIFFSWLIPTSVVVPLFIITDYYRKKNKQIWELFNQIEDDMPHLLNYFSVYLDLNIPVENIFKEIITDYKRHGFEDHPTMNLMKKIDFSLSHKKDSIKSFIKNDLKKISPIKNFNAILKQIVEFSDFSLKEASKVTKRIRSQEVNLMKLNDYILTLLNNSITLISTTISMLVPLLSSMAIIMSLFIVNFIKYLTKNLELIASIGGGKANFTLIDISKVISPIYLELIISFYVIEIIYILAFIKSNLKYGYDKYKIIEQLSKTLFGYIMFSIFLIIGYLLFNVMFKTVLKVT